MEVFILFREETSTDHGTIDVLVGVFSSEEKAEIYANTKYYCDYSIEEAFIDKPY